MGAPPPPQGVSFVSADRGWIVGGGFTSGTRIFATTDGGQTWKVQYQAANP